MKSPPPSGRLSGRATPFLRDDPTAARYVTNRQGTHLTEAKRCSDQADHLREFWNGDIDGAYRHQLSRGSVTLEQLRAAPGGVSVPLTTQHAKYAQADTNGSPRGFATPSRRVEIYSETFLTHGYSLLPIFEEPPVGPVARPDLAVRFPLILTTAKSTLFCQSQGRSLPSLRKRAMDPEVQLHPAAARARGIAGGDWVTIETPDGRVRARARFNDTLDPRVVIGEHGWWQGAPEIGAPGYDSFGPDSANLNLIIGTAAVDPVSGTAPHKSYLCEVRPLTAPSTNDAHAA